MNIYIIRHGQTDWNVEGIMQGNKDSKLTEQGKLEALNLGASLKDTSIDYIYTSPLSRAHDTALLIKDDRNIPVEVYENLKEMSFGVWEGIHSDDIKRGYKDEYSNFWNEPHLYTPIDGESFDELIERVRISLDNIITLGRGENILLVTHSIVIKAIYSIIKNYELKDFWNPPYINNTCMTILKCNENTREFILEADTSHTN